MFSTLGRNRVHDEEEQQKSIKRALSSPTGFEDEGDFVAPAGKRVEWTETGQPYLVAEEGEEGDSEDAADEHLRKKLSLMVSLDDVEKLYGIGTRVYFLFLSFIIFTNFLLGAISALSYLWYLSSRDQCCAPLGNPNLGSIYETWCFERMSDYLIVPGTHNRDAPFCQRDSVSGLAANLTACVESGIPLLPAAVRPTVSRQDPFNNPGFVFNELFTSEYTEVQRAVWTTTTAFCSLLTLSFGIVWYNLVQYKLRRGHFISKTSKSKDHDNPWSFAGFNSAEIPGAHRVTALTRLLHIVGSYIIFCALLGLSFGCVYGLELINKRDIEEGFGPRLLGFRAIDLAITTVVTVINMFFSQLCARLTRFELHQYWADHRRHHVAKLYLFKILNVTAMYAAIGVVPLKNACPYADSGKKFLLLMITDLVLQNAIELSMPYIKMFLARYIKALRSKTSDVEGLPDFDVAVEYLELLYRQYVVYLGLSLFPMMPLFAVINSVTTTIALVNVLEYIIDKFRMVKVCKPPARLDLTMKLLLASLLSLTALLAAVLPPIGTVFVLLGEGLGQSHPDSCPLFSRFNPNEQPISEICNSLLAKSCRCAFSSYNCEAFGLPSSQWSCQDISTGDLLL